MEPVADPRPSRTLGNFVEGAFLIVEGARFIRNERGLWALALVPIFFAFVCIGSVTALFVSQLDWIYASWTQILPVFEIDAVWDWLWVGPARVFFWLVGALAMLMSFAVSLIGGLLLANLLAAPFLDQLSQRVESIVFGLPSEGGSGGFRTLMREALASFGAELARLGFLASLWVGLSVVGFLIPGGQLITGPALVVLTVLFLPLDYAGFALDRLDLSFRDRRVWLLENRSLMLGFGGVAFVACLVPGLNLLVLPAQVTAGTLLVARRRPLA